MKPEKDNVELRKQAGTESPEVEALAREIFDVGMRELFAKKLCTRLYTWEERIGTNSLVCLVIARHVRQTTISRDVIASALARAKAREFFEDGLSADLHYTGITTIPAAYARGHGDAVDELAAEITREGGAK